MGVAAAGSFATDSMDEFSDIDLILAVEPEASKAIMSDRRSIAASLGPLLSAFTGEHVGEPRLMICLYGPPLLHVDIKFVSLPDVTKRVEDPVVLWERDGRLTSALQRGVPAYPEPDLQWIEDRIWVWVHYAAAKIARGELFEAVEFLSFLRVTVLGPLALVQAGARPAGVRRLETFAPAIASELRETIADADARSCAAALRRCIEIYRKLRGAAGTVRITDAAERASVEYLLDVERRLP